MWYKFDGCIDIEPAAAEASTLDLFIPATGSLSMFNAIIWEKAACAGNTDAANPIARLITIFLLNIIRLKIGAGRGMFRPMPE